MLFTKCYIMYPVGPVCYFPGHPSNTILSGVLKFYIGFQKVTYEPLENCDFFDPQSHTWRSSYQTKNNIDYLQIKKFKSKHQINMNFVVPTGCAL